MSVRFYPMYVMNLKLILIILFFSTIQVYSQTKNSISLVYGRSNNDVDIHGAIGDFGYKPQTGILFGLIYTHDFSKRFSLETGLQFSDNKVRLNYIVGGVGEITRDGKVQLITIPIFAKRTFFKYFFIDGGLLLEHQTNYSADPVVNDQSGVGLGLGFGGKYQFDKVTLFVNPFFQVHGLITGTDGSHHNLLETGLKFGIGYNF